MEAQRLLVPLYVKPNLINPERKWEKKGREGGKELQKDGMLCSGLALSSTHTQSVCHGLMLVDLWIWHRQRLQHCSNPHSSVRMDLQTGLAIAEAYCNTSSQ